MSFYIKLCNSQPHSVILSWKTFPLCENGSLIVENIDQMKISSLQLWCIIKNLLYQQSYNFIFETRNSSQSSLFATNLMPYSNAIYKA